MANVSGAHGKLTRNPARPKRAAGGLLNVVWTLPFADSDSVEVLHNRLRVGHKSGLLQLKSWECGEGYARARLTPEAPFEDVVELIWSTGREPSGLWLDELSATDYPPGSVNGRVPGKGCGRSTKRR